MSRYKFIDTQPKVIPVDLVVQLLPDMFEHALNHPLGLDADPLAELRNTGKIKFVMKNGRLYDGNTLAETYPTKRVEPVVPNRLMAPATKARAKQRRPAIAARGMFTAALRASVSRIHFKGSGQSPRRPRIDKNLRWFLRG